MNINFKLFIYNDIDLNETYWEQVESPDGWLPLNDGLYDGIIEEGWVEDLEFVYDDIYITDFVYKKLKLTKEDEIGLFNFDIDVINKFNDFDIELKNKQEYPYEILDFLDYISGDIFIIKYIN